MEHHRDRNQAPYRQDIYDGQRQTQSPATYGTSSMMAARFRTPQLPQRTTTSVVTQGLTHPSFMGQDHFSGTSMHGGFQYPGTGSVEGLEHMSYGTHQQQTELPSYGPTGFTYGLQQTSQDQMMQHYQSNSMRSMSSASSSFDMTQTPQLYSSAQSHHGQSSPTTGPSMYEHMSLPHHPYQTAPSASDNAYVSFNPYEQARQQFVMQDSSHDGQNSDLSVSFEQYQTQTKKIFTFVKNGQLAPTADLLLQISRYLIGNVELLGLDRDDKGHHEERLKLWDTFNQCWLTTLQAQLNTTRLIIRTGQRPTEAQSMLDSDTLEALGQELVRLCDGVEKIGLVDYQMGVAEEQIVELLIKCLDMLGPASPNTPRASASSRS